MTQSSYASLLYMSCFGLSYSPDDLRFILKNSNSTAENLISDLSPETVARLRQIGWRKKWEEFLRAQETYDLNYVDLLSEYYPRAFHLLDRPPLFLSIKGKPLWQERRLLSVVGSREPGKESLTWMSYHLPLILKEYQMGVVSGGARGIDQWAHQISKLCQMGTLCILPSGLLKIYPQSFERISSAILEKGGCLLSIYPINQEMRKFFFHQRNHLIAALGEALLVVEAGVKSGSLVTAKQALDLGREIYCLPFSPWSGRGAGNNQLIKDGAQVITSEKDFIQVYHSKNLFSGPELPHSVG